MKTTKKIVALALAVIMAISLIACGGNTDNSPDPTPDTNIIQMPEGSTFSVKFMDVDNGDAALVECDGKYVLINGGNAGFLGIAGGLELHRLAVKKHFALFCLVHTHNHFDEC